MKIATVTFKTPVKVTDNANDIAKTQYRACEGGTRPDEPACALEYESPFVRVTLRGEPVLVPLTNVVSLKVAEGQGKPGK